jgi:tetratricopeptide (TPR) repeat protein
MLGSGHDATGPKLLLGRENETAALERLLMDTRSGKGHTVLVTGPGGIGKTSILRWLDGAATGLKMKVRWGYCLPDAKEPFFSMEQLFHQEADTIPWIIAPGVSAQSQRRIESKRGRPQAPGSIPMAFLPLMSGRGPASPVEGRAPANVLMDYLSILEDDARATQCVLLLDDFHWADQDSVQALAFLSRNVGRLPILLAVALREDEVQDPALRRILKEIRNEGLATDLPLKGLGEKDTQKLLELTVADPLDPRRAAEVARLLIEQTGGNPYFLKEVVHLWQGKGLIRKADGRTVLDAKLRPGAGGVSLGVPDSVSTLLQQRLNVLTRDERAVLDGAAILGQVFEVAPLEELVKTWSSNVSRLLGILAMKRGLVIPEGTEGTTYEFAHALLRDAVVGSIPMEKRTQLSEQAAAWWAAHIPADVERISGFYEAAGASDKALVYVDKAIDQALQMHAHERVKSYFERRLELMERTGASKTDFGEWGLRIVDQLATDGGTRWAEPIARRVLKMDPPSPSCLALELYAANFAFSTNPEEGKQILSTVGPKIKELQGDRAKALQGRLEVVIADRLYSDGSLVQSEEHALAALAMLPEDEVYYLGRAYFLAGWAESDRNLWGPAVSNLEKGLAVVKRGRVWGLLSAYMNLEGTMRMLRGDLRAAMLNFKEATEVCKNLGAMRNYAVAMCNLALTKMTMGDLDDAEAVAKDAVRVAEAFGMEYPRAFASQCLGEVLTAKGQVGEAFDLFQKSKTTYLAAGASDMNLELDLNIAEARIVAGDAAGASEFCKTLKDEKELTQDQLPRYLLLKARIAIQEGDKDKGKEDAETSLRLSGERKLRYWEGRSLLVIYEWERKFGTPEGADKVMKEAEKALKDCGVHNAELFLPRQLADR